MFAEVVLSKVSKDIDRIYHYVIPQHLIAKVQIGSRVVIPFGRRIDVGYVVGLVEKSEIKNVKEILKVSSEAPLFTPKQVELARWMANYYGSFFSTALKLMLPPTGKIRNLRSETRDKFQTSNFKPQITLTVDQQKVLELIISAIKNEKFEKFLLYGIAGSGKTEVYLQLIAYLLSIGKSSIVLVPEISLTPQLVQRFRARFGSYISVIHSEMSKKERDIEWWRIAYNEAKVVLGARSALFVPVSNLGLIIIDEEHETTYKSQQSPRYHAREVAFQLGQMFKAAVVLGSATPSLETYYRSEIGVCKRLILPQRIDKQPLPPVEVVDMRKEENHLMSTRLRQELKEVLGKKEQAILFINRRGFFTFVICRNCGYPIECPRCSVSLIYDSSVGKLRCSRCRYFSEASIICPRCRNSNLRYLGVGTQRIEKEVAEIFPTARILRWDRDAVSKRGSHEVFFSAFAEGKADVLIGTQMVTKALDVAKVTLVGVISADFALNLPDFRAAERTFQLLAQVTGGAGRHHLPGKVIIQTYNPKHYAIVAVAQHDYESFYRQEIEARRELNYPPFTKLISLLIAGEEERKVIKVSEDLKKFLEKILKREVLGPVPAPISRLRGFWRYRILLKGRELEAMREAVLEALQKIVFPKEVKVTVDVDPIDML
ncbi:MAG: replication restart helicase PriA [Candidatus Margulisiibacteriota bacterium]